MNKIKTIFIVGPTASGKTSLSIDLAKKFSGEIICADSMQIYKGIHIASAAPDEEEKQGVPHHLFEFLDLDSRFSVADYVTLARKCIKDIDGRKNIPIVVGGTGLYISSLLDNTQYHTENTDYELRKRLEERFDKNSAEKMLSDLSEFDPQTAARLHPNNRRRIIRAFEVYYLTGKTVTELNALSHTAESEIEPLVIGITYADREVLYKRINQRTDMMIQSGLIQEAGQTMGNGSGSGAFQAIGHKELYAYIKGECTLEDATELLKRQTRRYAKRQLTWFKRDSRVNWIYADTENIYERAHTLAREFLKEEHN